MVIDIVAYERREKMLKLREELLSIEEDRILGKKGYTLEETDKILSEIIEEASNAK